MILIFEAIWPCADWWLNARSQKFPTTENLHLGCMLCIMANTLQFWLEFYCFNGCTEIAAGHVGIMTYTLFSVRESASDVDKLLGLKIWVS